MKEKVEPQRRIGQKESLSIPVGTRDVVSANLPTQTPLLSLGEGLRPSLATQPHTLIPLSPDQQEALAQTIYNRIDGLSLKNARKLVSMYTEKNIRFALNRLQQRTNLDNPSGFFITVLHSSTMIFILE